MEFKDYYQVLGVARDADADAIKKTFRRLARKYHPDVSTEADAPARMSEINEANAVLSDPERRAAYDDLAKRHAAGQAFEPPPDWASGFEFSGAGPAAGGEDFSDFFSSLFGARTRGGGFADERFADQSGGRFQSRGGDHHARIDIDLADAYSGAVRAIQLRSAKLDDTGRTLTQARTLEVRIPKGVKEGQLIRLAGQGSPGVRGGKPGDLYLEIHFGADGRYRIVERDVHQRLRVAPWEAALGAKIELSTPGGRLEVRVPAGSKSGSSLRLKGRGIPGTPSGDLYLEIEIVLPPADTDKARALYETMAREMQFDPRAGEG